LQPSRPTRQYGNTGSSQHSSERDAMPHCLEADYLTPEAQTTSVDQEQVKTQVRGSTETAHQTLLLYHSRTNGSLVRRLHYLMSTPFPEGKFQEQGIRSRVCDITYRYTVNRARNRAPFRCNHQMSTRSHLSTAKQQKIAVLVLDLQQVGSPK
jgi:hypothetical protein